MRLIEPILHRPLWLRIGNGRAGILQRRVLKLMIDKRGDRLLGVELIFVDGNLRRLGWEIDQHIFCARLLRKGFLSLSPRNLRGTSYRDAELDGRCTGLIKRCRRNRGVRRRR